MATPKVVRLGSTGTYTNKDGKAKLAFVAATPESVVPGTSLDAPEEGHVHLAVFSIKSGGFSTRSNIAVSKPAEGEATFQVG